MLWPERHGAFAHGAGNDRHHYRTTDSVEARLHHSFRYAPYPRTCSAVGAPPGDYASRLSALERAQFRVMGRTKLELDISRNRQCHGRNADSPRTIPTRRWRNDCGACAPHQEGDGDSAPQAMRRRHIPWRADRLCTGSSGRLGAPGSCYRHSTGRQHCEVLRLRLGRICPAHYPVAMYRRVVRRREAR